MNTDYITYVQVLLVTEILYNVGYEDCGYQNVSIGEKLCDRYIRMCFYL